jgi:hypothetical protein
MQRWSWGEYAHPGDREPQEKTRDRFKDMPDVLRYAAMDHPTFAGYTRGLQVFRMMGRR